MSGSLANRKKVVGLKQTRRAVENGEAQCVYLGTDADPAVIGPLKDRCRQAGITVVEEATMAQLGRRCGISVGTAACATLL